MKLDEPAPAVLKVTDRLVHTQAPYTPNMSDFQDAFVAKAREAPRQREKERETDPAFARGKQIQKEMERQRLQEEKQRRKDESERHKLLAAQDRESKRLEKEKAKAALQRAKVEQREWKLRAKTAEKELQKELKKNKAIEAALAPKAPRGDKSAGIAKKQRPAAALTSSCADFPALTSAGAAAVARAAVGQQAQNMLPRQREQESVSTPQTPKPSSKDSNELEEFFVCDYNCGFRSDYASVEEHEKTCPLKQSRSITLAQQQQVSVTLQPFVHPDLRIHSRPRTMHVCHLCK